MRSLIIWFCEKAPEAVYAICLMDELVGQGDIYIELVTVMLQRWHQLRWSEEAAVKD